MSFLKPRKVEKNYDLLSGCAWYIPNVAGIFYVLAWFLAGMIIGMVLTSAIYICLPGIPLCYTMLIVYPVQFIPVLMFTRLKSLRNSAFDRGYALDSNHFGSKGGFLAAILAALATVSMSVILDPLTAMLPKMDENLVNTMEKLMEGPLWVSLLSMCVLAPVLEEWLCRGIVLRGLLNYSRKGEPGEDGSRRGMKPALAIAISALFFATIHGNLWQGFAAMAMGCFFGYVYYRTGSLKLTILMHCTNNTLSVLLSKLSVFGDEAAADASLCELLPWPWFAAAFAVNAAIFAVSLKFFSKIGLQSPQGNCDLIPNADDIADGTAV